MSYVPQVGPEGFEPSPFRLKGGCAAVTPRPQKGRGRMRFSRSRANIVVLLAVVRGGEPTAGDVSDRHASVTTPDRVQVGMVGVEPTRSCSQGTRVAVTLHPDGFSKSERPDSNRDHRCAMVLIPTPGPRPGSSSRSPTLCSASSPSGSRTPAAADHRCAGPRAGILGH